MNTVDTLLNYVGSQLTKENPDINVDTQLFAEGYLDSTAMLELILWLGDKFNVSIQNEDLTPENFATVRNMVDFVERKTSPQPHSQYDRPVAAGNN